MIAAADVQVDAIPLELRERLQWVGWRAVRRTGQHKPTKVPYVAGAGADRKASSTDRATWRPVNHALAAYRRGACDGVGYVLAADDPYTAVDLDRCRDPESGVLAPWAQVYVRLLASYTEVSPSGAGLRIFVRGQLPPGGRKRGPVEAYDRERFVTVTGDHLQGTPATIEERQAELEAFHRLAFPEPVRQVAPAAIAAPATPVDLDDAALIEKACAAADGGKFARLWAGDTSGYCDATGKPDHSAADQALCNLLAFWTGRDEARIDRLFRQSGLYRPKWERGTYREPTIRKAIAGCRDVYHGGRPHTWPELKATTPAPTNGNGHHPERSEGSETVCIPVARYRELVAAEQRLQRVSDVLANPGIDPGTKVVAIAAVSELERRDGWRPSQLEQETDVPEGFAIVANERLGKLSGLAAGTAGRQLKTLTAYGVLRQKQIGRQIATTDKTTGEIKTAPRKYSALALVGTADEALARIASIEAPGRTRKAGPGRGHTGCPDHPLAGTYERTRASVHCEVCHRVLQSKQLVFTERGTPGDPGVVSTQKQVVFTEPTGLQAERLRRRLDVAEVDALADRENAADLRATLEALYARAAPPEDEWRPPDADELIWWARENGAGA